MTIIVWDGETLATDRQANDGYEKWESEKAWYVTHKNKVHMVSGYGVLKDIIALREWFRKGADEDCFPLTSGSNSVSLSAQLIVVNATEGLKVYQGVPHPIVRGFTPCAFGNGKDFALGALSMGARSVEAVSIANEHSLYCGKGVTELSLKDMQVESH